MTTGCEAQMASLAAAPEDPAALLALGVCQVENDQARDAEQTLGRLLELSGEHAEGRAWLAAAVVRMGRLEEALEHARQACDADRNCAQAFIQRCWTERRAGNLTAAIEAGRRAVELAPTPNAYNYLTIALLAADQVDEALACSERCLAADPRNISALYDRTNALAAAGRVDEGRWLSDFEHLLWVDRVNSVNGYPDVASFNRALTEEVLAAEGRQLDPLQTVDLMPAPRPAAAAFRSLADAATRHYLKRLPPPGERITHPFLRYRPERWDVFAWGTRTRQFDLQEHHIHQHAWISGVYYASVPGFVGQSQEELGGCIEFARFLQYSDRPVETEAMVLPPREGMIVMFPSYFPHRVLPFSSDSVRVSLAFNIIPLDQDG